MRGGWLRVHRYAGLLIAGFLAVTALTGSLLAWNTELDEALNPGFFRAPVSARGAILPPLALREIVQQKYPQALVTRVPLAPQPGTAAAFLLRPKPGGLPLANDQVFIHPATGHILGERRWGDITQGMHNLMPFLYRLHYSLALGPTGALVLGIVAVVWTVDCLIGLYLTFPAKARPSQPAARWTTRWSKAWKISTRSPYRLLFDLHRASGLWLWIALFGMAISSVALNLPQVYDPLLGAVAHRQPGADAVPARAKPLWAPRLDWQPAYERARGLMQQEAAARNFSIEAESSFSYDPRRGLYRYDVRSSLDIKSKGGSTRVFVDGDTGDLAGIWLPTGTASGDTVTTWLSNLHMAAVGGRTMQLAVSLLGAAVFVLCLTGVLVWLRKRKATLLIAANRRTLAKEGLSGEPSTR